jgi:hypothetical protein
MPEDEVEQVRGVVANGAAESVSAWVADAVHDKLARQRALARLDELWGDLPEQPLRWARDRLGVSHAAAEVTDGTADDDGPAAAARVS